MLALLAAILVVGYVLLNGGSTYTVHPRFQNAAQLVKGNLVQVAGVPVGKIQSIDLTPDGPPLLARVLENARRLRDGDRDAAIADREAGTPRKPQGRPERRASRHPAGKAPASRR